MLSWWFVTIFSFLLYPSFTSSFQWVTNFTVLQRPLESADCSRVKVKINLLSDLIENIISCRSSAQFEGRSVCKQIHLFQLRHLEAPSDCVTVNDTFVWDVFEYAEKTVNIHKT